MDGAMISIDKDALVKILVAHKNYIAKFSKEGIIVQSDPDLVRYVSDILNKQCNLTCVMEPDKYIMVTQDQYVCTLIVDLYVAPEFRHQGIGTRLINSIEGPIKLECFDNNPATKFYEKLGFEKQLEWQSCPGCRWYLRL